MIDANEDDFWNLLIGGMVLFALPVFVANAILGTLNIKSEKTARQQD